MNGMWKEMRTAVLCTLVLVVLACGAYPLAVWGIAQAVFPWKANGSMVVRGSHVVGSWIIGQAFTGPQYFHPRPSAAGAGYDPMSSGGSNLGPLSAKFMDAVKARAAAYRRENGLSADAPVPADALTASASGLDPHISPENAMLQADRVAKSRGLGRDEVTRLVEEHTEGRDLGFLGEPRVNVMALNLDLDKGG
jgi:potassium-transporting ATPase KdpC subunit